MVIGLLTVHCSINPGASLQAYALSKTLQKLGYDVLIIDYRPDYFISEVDEIKRKKKKRTVKGILVNAVFGGNMKKNHHLYLDFENKYLPQKTKRYNNFEELMADFPVCDLFLCGSDQIWNPQHTCYDSVMELSFAKKRGVPCYSYAASIGQDTLMEKDIDFLSEQLCGFSMISVREKSAKNLLENELKLTNVVQNIDPTLLMDCSDWRDISSSVHEKIRGKYILFYPLAENEIVSPLLKRAKELFGLPIVAMSRKLKKDVSVDLQLRSFSPNDFVDLIDHAEYIITNSFHGCVFSLLFQKKLISYKNTKRNTRMECLFDLFGIQNCQISHMSHFEAIDWNLYFEQIKINEEVLEKERVAAIQYLKTIGEQSES